MLLLLPLAAIPLASGYEPGDEAEIFGHTFTEEYWTNDSIEVATQKGNASFTASYVGVDDFQAFLLAFNKIVTNDSKEFQLPYQLFGMHYTTPEDQEVFIGAIFAFLLVHNESFGGNNLPDVGNEDTWICVPMSTGVPWNDVTPGVEAIPVSKIGDNHYRFGMRYTNMSVRIVATDSIGGFIATLLLPILTCLISELVVQYDVYIDTETGQVHAETLYTIGQVTRAKWLGLFEAEPRDLINETFCVSAVHYLSVFTSNYRVANNATGNQLQPPTSTTPMTDNITIQVGSSNERAFDIGLGREYSLINESTDPWTTISESETALNSLLAAEKGDFALVGWQAPISAFLFSHMAYYLSPRIRNTYSDVEALVDNSETAFHDSQWWYAVTFPEWNGYRVQQDPTYTAYTNVIEEPTSTTDTGIPPTDGDGLGGIVILGIIAVVVIGLVMVCRRRD